MRFRVILSPVVSVDMTGLAQSFEDNEAEEFTVEVGLDQTRVQGSEALKGDDTLSWNKEFLLYISIL